MNKDVIYIDPDDEITSITDKVTASSSAVVALVLPKRCPTLQSSVNLKILNKTANGAKKKLVLVTSEPAILQIAGMAGMYAAKTLQSKPAIPSVDSTLVASPEVEEVEEIGTSPESKSSEELTDEDEVETMTMPASKTKKPKNTQTKNQKKDKKLKVPNFDSFRNKMFIIAGVFIALVVAGYFAYFVLPKAKITITSDTQTLDINTQITASSDLKTDNTSQQQFALQTKTIEKTDTAKAPATGERNDGTKASGSITIYNCDYSDGFTLPAGTAFTTPISSGTATFTSNEAVSIPKFTGSSSSCKTNSSSAGKATVAVTSSGVGSQYNLSSGRSFSFSAITDPSKVIGIGGSMGGGQDKITKIVSQADCSKAKDTLQSGLNADEYKKKLLSDFESEGVVASIDTFQSKTLTNTCSPAVSAESTEVTATAKTQYTMSGVNSKSLNQLVTEQASKQAGGNQTILDTGLSKATLTVNQNKPNGDIVFNLKTKVTAGLKQDSAAIADSIKGKNARQTSDTIKSLPGVKDVKVNYSPFWVNKTPNKTNKINIIYVNGTN